jgi:RimJ/RimL family protein N-acetyltransferase
MRHIEPVQDRTAPVETPGAGHEEWVAELPLTGGPIVRFRHVRPDDEHPIMEAIGTASRETLLHRFFSPMRSVSPGLLRQMLAIDRAKETCLVGAVTASKAVRIICGARYVKLGPGAAEIAITVHDDFQRRGLGTFLLKLLARLAQAEGIRRFEAEVLASNHKMLKLFKKVAPRSTGHWTGDVYHIVIDVETIAHGEGSPGTLMADG